jgi:hypothetical protein
MTKQPWIAFDGPALVVVGFLLLALALAPLTSAQTPAESALPRLVRFGGTVRDLNGTPMTGVVGITFALYSERSGGAALWIETQNVTADSNGHYVAVLGSAKPDGLPADLFTSEQARWVGVQVSGQAEQGRVLLVSAPYALKAGDAETIGGLPPSAFVLANPSGTHKNSAAPANPDVTGLGTVGYIPMWDTTSDIVDSVIFQKSSKIGISTTTPAATLDVNGTTDVRDTLTLFPNSTDNTLEVNGTAFKISSAGEVTFISGQTFPGAGTITGITTANGSGLSGGGTSGALSLKVPSAGITNTMLKDSKVTLNASTAGGLTVPGAMTLGDTYTIGLKTCSANQILQYSGTAWACATAGTGSVTSVASGAGLTGGPITTSGTLSIATGGVTNAMLANSKVTLNSGTGITAPGAMTLGDTYTVSINTSVVPELTTANTFTGTQTISSSTGNGVAATSSAAGDSGVFASNSSTTSGYGVFASNYSATGSAVAGINYATGAGNAYAIYGQSNGSAGTGVYGTGAANGVYGNSSTGSGVYGQSNGTASGSAGVYGIATNSSATGQTYGVYGTSAANDGAGVYGQFSTLSTAGNRPVQAGIWGDGGQYLYGVLGTSDSTAGYFLNNADGAAATLIAVAENALTYPAVFTNDANDSYCQVNPSGDFSCSGTYAAMVPIENGARKVALSAIESSKNWLEDAGAAQLVNGSAVVALDPEFVQTVNTEMDYKVFPVPNGDCKGLYVTGKTATSFEVRELGGGTSNIAFDYRIMALRKNYENVRFADHTNDPDPRKVTRKYRQSGTPPAEPVLPVRAAVKPAGAPPK